MKEKTSKMLNYLPYLLVIMIMAIICIPRNAQNDLFFDIRSAKDILKYGLDFKDHFCFIPDLVYLYHHYLYDLILFGIYKIADLRSVFIMFLCMYTILGFIIFYVTNRHTNNKLISLITAAVTLFLMKGFFQTRVQSISYILFYLEVYFLNKLYDEGKTKDSIILIFLSILMVNLHMPVWIIYLVLFLPFLQEIVFDILRDTKISKYLSNKLEMKAPKNLRLFLITFGVTFLTGFLSPFKLQPYTFFLKTINNSGYEIINEMQKTVLMNNGWLMALILLATLLIFTNKKIKIRNLFYILGLGVMSLFASRHTAYFLLIIPTILTTTVFEYKKNKKDTKLIYNLIAVALLLVIYIYEFTGINIKNFNYDIVNDYPVKSAVYIKENTDYKNIKLYNDFNYGSYLAYENIPIFIDSRAEVYMKQFNRKHDIMQDYINSKEYTYHRLIFDYYKFDYALVYESTDIYYYLKDNINYKEIFKEETRNENYVLFELRK